MTFTSTRKQERKYIINFVLIVLQDLIKNIRHSPRGEWYVLNELGEKMSKHQSFYGYLTKLVFDVL
jgi:hypothetical protein